jgi:hypothetical protein
MRRAPHWCPGKNTDTALTTSLREAKWLPVIFHRIFPPQAGHFRLWRAKHPNGIL